jgi:signal transduction histidine kinase
LKEKILIVFIIAILFSHQNGYCLSIPNHKVDSVALYTAIGSFQKALIHSEILTARFLKNKQYKQLSAVSIQQASIYNLLGDSEKAVSILSKTLKLIQSKNEKFWEIILIKKIAEIYTSEKEYNSAKNNLLLALRKSEKIKNDSLSNRINQSLFTIHLVIKSDSSLYYLQKTTTYYKKNGSDLSLYRLYRNRFYYYKAKTNLKLAKTSIDSSVYYAKKILPKNRIILALSNLANYQINTEGDYKKAKETYLEIFKYSDQTHTIENAEYYFNFGKVLDYLGDYKEANQYLLEAAKIKDSIYKKDLVNAVDEVELKYKLAKTERIYKASQKLLIEKQLENRKTMGLSALLFIITLVIFYTLFQNSKLKQKNKLKDIENERQQDIINASVEGQEIERKKIASFLHDNISGLLTSAGLHLSALSSQKELPIEEISKTKAILEEAHDKVRDLSHELLPALLAKFGLFYALQDLCEKNTTSLLEFEYLMPLTIKTRYDEKFEMKIYNIISELFNNVIKHSQANKAKLTINIENDLLIIQVSDNGKGFDMEKFEIGESFGLNQVQARINKINGSIFINSKINSGTSISIKVPFEIRK